ncbi:MAG: hypothetical protein U1A07_05555 [Phenylobacterium sp.]|jgi:hypothetical protein|nr:hypothetical protein [Phenylobacterium sp.]MDZ4318296.1 hypothetical protein [Phenylobacterium sp.]
MGLSLSWVAVKAERRQALLECLGLELAGEVSQEVGVGLAMAELPSGWLVLAGSAFDDRLLDELPRVSEACGEALGAEIIDTVSFTRAKVYRDGQLQWSLASEEDQGEPMSMGEVPAIPSEADEYEAPLALAESLCGYRAGETDGLEWFRLGRRATSRTTPPETSLREAMRAELLPLLQDLGWSFPPRPAMADGDVITRQLHGRQQSIWFDYSSGVETYINVQFLSQEVNDGEASGLSGGVGPPRVKLSFWQRFSWKRLSERTSYPPPSADRIGAAIAQAREEILVADAYLRGGVTDNRIYITARWPRRA